MGALTCHTCSPTISHKLPFFHPNIPNCISTTTNIRWCEIKKTHASYQHIAPEVMQRVVPWPVANKPQNWQENSLVKGRYEPCHLPLVLTVVAAVRGVAPAALANTVHENTARVFFPSLAANSAAQLQTGLEP